LTWHDQAKTWFKASLELRQAQGDWRGQANALAYLGFITAQFSDQVEAAERLARQSLEIRDQIGDRLFLSEGLFDLAGVCGLIGKFAEALPLYLKAIAIQDELGIRPESYVLSHINLSLVETNLGHYDQARRRLRVNLALAQTGEYQYAVGLARFLLGLIDLATDRPDEAGARLAESCAVFEQLGVASEEIIVRAMLGLAACRSGQLAQAQQHLIQSLQAFTKPQGMIVVNSILSAAAYLLAAQGRSACALEIDALATRHPYVANSRWYKDVVASQLEAAAATLPPDVVTAAKERGRVRDLWATIEALPAEFKSSDDNGLTALRQKQQPDNHFKFESGSIS
jgi:tetratricopeptide (TPR) repeat protein